MRKVLIVGVVAAVIAALGVVMLGRKDVGAQSGDSYNAAQQIVQSYSSQINDRAEQPLAYAIASAIESGKRQEQGKLQRAQQLVGQLQQVLR